jgi:signal transduction histidine kinase
MEASIRWVHLALGTSASTVRFFELDAGGRLRLLLDRDGIGEVARGGSTRRREAIAAKWPSVVKLRRPAGASLALLPLTCRGDVLGIIEVVAPTDLVHDRLGALGAVAGQTATTLHHIRLIEDARRAADVAADTSGLMQELLEASSREHAVVIAARFCWKRLRLPVVGWSRDPGDAFHLVVARGAGKQAASALGNGALDLPDADAIVREGTSALGRVASVISRDGNAVLLLTHPPKNVSRLLETVEAGLSLAMDRVAFAHAVESLADSIDTGIAWTAHEFRAPLLGVEKAIDLVAGGEHVPEEARQLLERAQADLRRLTGTVDGFLRWSVGSAEVRRRPTDLGRLVSESVGAVSGESGSRGVSVVAPERAIVDVDPLLLRVAIENLLRNSLEHTSSDVELRVELTSHEATVSVADRGAGIPQGDRSAIFDPFDRERRTARRGRGLGLFIAQRAVQAQGGVLWLESTSRGSVFRLRVPLEA